MEEKVNKRSLESTGKTGLSAAGPGLLPRKPTAGSTGTHGKAVSPPQSPRASPVTSLKAKVIQKVEDVSKPPAYTYPATPSSHPSSPPPASPPPTPGLTRKEEAPENVVEKKDLEVEKEAPSPFQALFTGGCESRTGDTEFECSLEASFSPSFLSVHCAFAHSPARSLIHSLIHALILGLSTLSIPLSNSVMKM